MDRVAVVLSRPPARTGSGSPGAAIVAAAALAALVAVVASPHAALVAKALADPFFHSTSAGAAIALLAWAGAAAATIAIFPAAPHARVRRAAAMVLIVSVLAGNAANLAGHVVHMTSLGLPASLAAYHWNGDANTYSYLLHAHEGKAALHTLIGPLAGAFAPALDVGQGLLAPGSRPHAVAASTVSLACGLALAGAVGASLVLMRAFAATGADRRLAALYVFCALNATKTIVDGGPLTYRFAPVFVVLCAVLASRSATAGVRRRLAALAVAALGAACLAAWAWIGRAESRDAALGFLTTVAVLAALMPPPQGTRGPRAIAVRATRNAAVLFALGALAASLLGSAIGPNLPLDADARATVCDAAGSHCAVRRVGGRTLAQVYLDAGEDPTKPHRTFVWRPDDLGPTRLALAVVANEPVLVPEVAPGRDGVARASEGGIALHAAGPLPTGAGAVFVAASDTLPAIFGTVPTPTSANNYHVYLHTVAARLRAGGLERFTLVPIRDRDDARALGLRFDEAP